MIGKYKLNEVYCCDSLIAMRELPDCCINTCITSPPYWGLRDYGVEGQLGLEKTPEEYVAKMVEIFREVRRVLRDDGTLWLNLGDSYSGSGKGIGSDHGFAAISDDNISKTDWSKTGLKPKDLIGIPWRVAFALKADGWYLRSDIIWHKPNPMPESVTDRPTKAHEYIFLMSKSKKYYYDGDAIKEPISESSISRLSQDVDSQAGSDRVPGKTNGPMKAIRPHGITRDRLLDYNSKEKILRPNANRGGFESEHELPEPSMLRNKRTVWTVATQPYKEAHFATFPEKLIEPCVLAGCTEGGVVLDPFGGAGTTGKVAKRAGRNYILLELNQKYVDIAKERLKQEVFEF